MMIHIVFGCLTVAIVFCLSVVIAVFGNAIFNWEILWLANPDKIHLTLIALSTSSASLLVSVKTMLSNKENKFNGYISNFDGKSAKLFIANEKDKLQLISTIRILANKQELPLSIKFNDPVLALPPYEFVELEISPLTIQIDKGKVSSLKAHVELLNGDVVKFKLIDKQ